MFLLVRMCNVRFVVCRTAFPLFCPSILPILTLFNRRFSRRRISQRGSWCERCSLWPVGKPRNEFSQRSQSPRRSRTDMCLQWMISLPPGCTESKYKQVSKMCASFCYISPLSQVLFTAVCNGFSLTGCVWENLFLSCFFFFLMT